MDKKQHCIELTVDEQIEVMERQINLPEANFTLAEKMAYMAQNFDGDAMFSKKARDIVRSNIARSLPIEQHPHLETTDIEKYPPQNPYPKIYYEKIDRTQPPPPCPEEE